ncbi:MAG: tetratricopeptide repeat protein [Verrucomicrobiota bacterium]|jgi:outer membrane protein assembly factor BamD (BamD/ComL family)
MTRLTCPFLFCCAFASLTTAGLADLSNTNSTAPNDAPTPRLLADQPSAPGAAHPPAPAAPPGPPDFAGANSTLASAANEPESDTNLEIKLQLARRERHDKSFVAAAQVLESILKTNAPPPLQRQALFDLAEVMQDDGQSARAQQIWSQYLQLYPQDPAVPDVLLRQGLLYRKMGVDGFAISKFYAVMSTALKLKLDNLAYYKKLVVQAQTEIADTYYLDSKFDEAADFFSRILKSGDAEANREQLEWKLIRSLSYLTNHTETIAKAQSFLSRFPNSPNLPEVRFLLARALTNMKRNPEAMQQVLLLLQSQQDNVSRDPETWAYWQRRAGNEIANQLYKEGDNVDALQIYLSLAQLDPSPLWQVPVLYQVGMAYEQLQQWQKATDTYTRILDRQKQLNTNNTPALALVLDMAQWRKDYIAWLQKARFNSLALRPLEPAGPASPAMP